jgi:hypothetical protein
LGASDATLQLVNLCLHFATTRSPRHLRDLESGGLLLSLSILRGPGVPVSTLSLLLGRVDFVDPRLVAGPDRPYLR